MKASHQSCFWLFLFNKRQQAQGSFLRGTTNLCLSWQVASLIAELASAAAAERGLTFDEGIEERLCAYSRAVAHFPTAIKEACLIC